MIYARLTFMLKSIVSRNLAWSTPWIGNRRRTKLSCTRWTILTKLMNLITTWLERFKRTTLHCRNEWVTKVLCQWNWAGDSVLTNWRQRFLTWANKVMELINSKGNLRPLFHQKKSLEILSLPARRSVTWKRNKIRRLSFAALDFDWRH